MAERTKIISIVEQDGSVFHALVQTPFGAVEVMANMTKEPGRLILNRVHVEGGGFTRAIMKQAAKN